MPTTRSFLRWRDVSRVFQSGSLLDAHLARLCVLYEDLRIEITGISEDSINALEVIGANYRRNVFLRRSILTLREFAEGFRLVDVLPEFQEIKSTFDTNHSKRWEKAVRFFSKYEPVLKKVRNDLGGHFGLSAALYSVDNLSLGSVEKIEKNRYNEAGGGAKLHFAGEIAATAFLRHLQGSTNSKKIIRLLRILTAGYKHSVWTTNVLIENYLWEKFRG